MRMGKVERTRRGEKKPPRADAKTKPKHAAGASVVGQLSPDILSTYYSPLLTELAAEALENYAANLLEYDDIVRDLNASKEKEAALDSDGSVSIDDPPEPPIAPLYRSEYYVKRLSKVLSETSNHFQSKKGGWKVQAKAARFERLMDEKYGMFRPFLKQHPEMDRFVRSLQVKYANGDFSPIRQGRSPIPKSTAVIILFMMKRGNVKWDILALSTLFFLVGLQPWALVILIAGAHTLLQGRKRRAIKPMETYIPTVEPYFRTNKGISVSAGESDEKSKIGYLSRPVGNNYVTGEKIEMSKYDTMILGSGPDALYTASLLSRSGRKVLVMTSKEDASGCYTIENTESKEAKKFINVPFDISCSNISKISGQQELLAPALSNSTDFQGGVRFAKIGSETDGCAFQILSVPGMGTDGGLDTPSQFILRGDGISSLMEDAASSLGDGWPDASGSKNRNSATGLYAATCESINSTAPNFYLSKLLEDSVNNMRSKGVYQSVGSRYSAPFLEKGFPSNPHLRSLLAAIGMHGENIRPAVTSMAAHVTNISAALSGEGMHYPVGGPRALCHALATVVEQSGGSVRTNVPVTELLFERDDTVVPDEKDKKEKLAPRCVGVKLSDGAELKFSMKSWTNEEYSPAVISMHGLITTFIRLMPDDIRTEFKVPRGLPALSESRPVFKLLFGLQGSAEDLEVTGIDFCRVPGATHAQNELVAEAKQVKLGEEGSADCQGSDKTSTVSGNQDVVDTLPAVGARGKQSREPKELKKHEEEPRSRFEPGVSWMKISFPSAKDPSFQSRHGNITTCVITVEADDDFVTMFDTSPKLYTSRTDKGSSPGEYQRLIDRIKGDLLNVFPQLEGKIACAQLIGPIHRGLSHNPERYAAKGVRPGSQYPGLFAGGSDLTVGESFSASIVGGWLAANAVMGYSAIDYLFLQKNITSDIINFLEEPDGANENDIAVPYDAPPHPELVGSS